MVWVWCGRDVPPKNSQEITPLDEMYDGSVVKSVARDGIYEGAFHTTIQKKPGRALRPLRLFGSRGRHVMALI